MIKKYDYIKEEEEEENEDEDDGLTKERRKHRIKTKKKFKRRRSQDSLKKIKGFANNRPRRHDWHELIEDEE